MTFSKAFQNVRVRSLLTRSNDMFGRKSAERSVPMAKSKLDYLQIKHLTGTQAEIAEVIGIEAYRKLVGYFGGERIAVAKPSTLINFAVARNIAEENDYSEEVMSALELSKKEQEKIIAGLK